MEGANNSSSFVLVNTFWKNDEKDFTKKIQEIIGFRTYVFDNAVYYEKQNLIGNQLPFADTGKWNGLRESPLNNCSSERTDCNQLN